MKFSVLMSLYYKEKPDNLNECFASLSRQTLPADEIVCVFDGPPGKMLEEVVEQWSKRLPVNVVRLEQNVGLGNALNEGLKHCHHPIVARMDTDDICKPERFEKQIMFLQNHPEIDVSGSYIDEFDGEPGNIISSRQVPENHIDIIQYAKNRNPFNHMSVIFKKEKIEEVGGYQDHYLMEDYNLWLRVLAAGGKMANIPESLVLARTGNDMIKRRHGFKYFLSEKKLAEKKYHLGQLTRFQSVISLLIRGGPRLLPVSVLRFVYHISRKRK